MRQLLFFTLLTCAGCFMPEQQPLTADKQQDSLQLIDQGTLFLRKGQLDRAQASFVVAFQLIPSAAALDGLGSVAYARKNFDGAEKLFRRAYEMDPTYGVALSNLALIYENDGMDKQARMLYQRAEVLEPRNIRLKNNYAALKARQNDFAGSRESFLEAAAIADNPIIESNVKRLEK